MNAFAMFAADEALRLANERQDGFRRERAIDRLAARAQQRGLFGGIASAVSSVRAALSAVDTDSSLPALVNYPYRG
jgi:hypothetical protein